MAQSITNLAFQRAIMDVATGMGGTLDGALLGLTKTSVSTTKTSTLAGFTAHEADFNTYARATITFGLARTFLDGTIQAAGGFTQFELANVLVTESIFNAFLMDSGAAFLIGSVLLPSGVPLTNLNQGLGLVPTAPWVFSQGVNGFGAKLLLTNHAGRLILNGITGMSGLLHNAKAHLSTYTGPLSVDTPLSTLAAAEANYGGYAAQTISTWSAAFVDADGYPKVGGSDLLWAPTSLTNTDTITTVYVTDSTSATLLFAYNLDVPQVLSTVDTGFRDSPTLWFGI